MLLGREQDRPQTVPSEKPEAAVERRKPLWLCGLDGGLVGTHNRPKTVPRIDALISDR
jgi:hypothetical protein